MTDQEINIAIAEAVGFVPMVEQTIPYRNIWSKMGITYCECDLPDYCNDLNAMHEAEKTLARENLLDIYTEMLSLIHEVDRGYFTRINWGHAAELATATARQRAEAFLKCKGLWREAILEKGTK